MAQFADLSYNSKFISSYRTSVVVVRLLIVFSVFVFPFLWNISLHRKLTLYLSQRGSYEPNLTLSKLKNSLFIRLNSSRWRIQQEHMPNQTNKNNSRCEEIRRRASWGVVDYALWDGDTELEQLLKPIFTKKRLVVWSLDHHFGPISDIRSLIEPLGVEFIEHTIYPYGCNIMCTCDHYTGMTPIDVNLIWYPDNRTFYHISHDPIAAPDIARADAFLVTCSIPLIELYMKYNRSIIAVAAFRYEYTLKGDLNRWRDLNERLRALSSKPFHVVGANSLYDVEYMQYFIAARPDYVPSFSAYTGEHYRQSRRSFLYFRARHRPIPDFWHQTVYRHYRKINASFQLEIHHLVYKYFEHSDLAQHLGLVHIPYQVSTMSFFEHYSMCIPLFVPSLNFLTQLHVKHQIVIEKTHSRYWGPSLPSHPAYNGSARVPFNDSLTSFIILDPNNEVDARAVRYWLSLSDFYTLPHVALFESIEELVEKLQLMWQNPSLLLNISEEMRITNRSRLKSILQYWRQRLLDIATFSPHDPN